MAKYKVLAKSFINNRIVEEGEIVEYDGKVSDNLELIKGGKAAPAAAADSGVGGTGDAADLA